MKSTLAIAAIIYGVSAIRLRNGRPGGDDEVPEEAKEAIKCIIDLAAEHGHEANPHEAALAIHYCWCDNSLDEYKEHCEAGKAACFPEDFGESDHRA